MSDAASGISFLQSCANNDAQDPYGGYVPSSMSSTTTAAERVVTGSHLLVSGPTGSGKSRRVLGPATVLWDGPVVNVSSKPDLVALCAQQRIDAGGEGRTYVLDFADAMPVDAMPVDAMPEGATRIYLDPVRLIRDDDDALEMATMLIDAGSGEDKSDTFWKSQAIGPLAALLRAAGADGIRWCVQAKNNYPAGTADGGDPDRIAHVVLEVAESEHLYDNPYHPELNVECSWLAAALRLSVMPDTTLEHALLGAMRKTSGQISSIALYMDTAMNAWLKSGSVPPKGAVLFTPTLLQHPRATLFIIAPGTGVGTGGALLCFDFILDRWRKNQTEKRKLPRLLFVVDELCNTAPWTKLPVVVTEARGMGVAVVAAVQSTQQFSRVFGHDAMLELRDVFPATLCLSGASEVYLWDHVDRVRDTYLKAGQDPPPPPPPPASTIDTACLFYRARPRNAVTAEEYVSGRVVDLPDISEIPPTLLPVYDVDAFEDHFKWHRDIDALPDGVMSVAELFLTDDDVDPDAVPDYVTHMRGPIREHDRAMLHTRTATHASTSTPGSKE